MRPRSVFVPVFVAAVVAAAGLVFREDGQLVAAGSRPSTVVQAGNGTITIVNFDYVPVRLTVRAGTRITVINHDQTAHTVTARSGAFDSGTVGPGQSRALTVSKPGFYTYYCQFHAFMSGTLTVVR